MSVPLRSCRDHDAEAWVLTAEQGQRLLAEVTGVPEPRPADIFRWRKLAPANAVAAAVRLATCRARAKAKFSRGDRMWLDPVGLEQATGEAVARHKAGRFACPLVVGRTGMSVPGRLSGALSSRSRPSSTIPPRPCSAPACSIPSPPPTV